MYRMPCHRTIFHRPAAEHRAGVGRPDDITSPDGETIHKDEFDIPHLLGVWDSAPYLHDGRAKTLLEIFQQHNPHDEHSTTSDLNEDQLRDLVEYLKTL
ncbi:MAG: hypothetical protein R3C56_36165 [Pirellulaceae bacterium]